MTNNKTLIKDVEQYTERFAAYLESSKIIDRNRDGVNPNYWILHTYMQNLRILRRRIELERVHESVVKMYLEEMEALDPLEILYGKK
jgi:hypothetical protein